MKLLNHEKKISRSSNVIIVISGLLFLIAGIFIGIIINNFNLLKITSEIRLVEIFNLLIAIIIPLSIALIITAWYDRNKFSKNYLIEETKSCIEYITTIQDYINNKYTQAEIINDYDRIKINIFFKNLNQKIGCLCSQLDFTYGKKTNQIVQEIKTKYFDYWKIVTGGELEKSNYKITNDFQLSTMYSNNQVELFFKRLIHIINQF
jgi:hypothetical protein